VTGETLATGWNLSDALARRGRDIPLDYVHGRDTAHLPHVRDHEGHSSASGVPHHCAGCHDRRERGIISGIPEQFTTERSSLGPPAIALVLFAISATIAMRLYARRDL